MTTPTTETKVNMTPALGLETINANMVAAVANDHEVWKQVNTSLNIASDFQDTDLIRMLTSICEHSFEFKAADSASLSRFIHKHSMNLKVAVSATKKTVKITRKDATKPATFLPAGDWARCKAPKKDKLVRTLADDLATLMVRRIQADTSTLADCAAVDLRAVLKDVTAQIESAEAKKAAAKAKSAK